MDISVADNTVCPTLRVILHWNRNPPNLESKSSVPGAWLYLVSPAGFERTRVHVPIPGLSEKLAGFRILHLTDLHLTRRWFGAYDELHAILREDPPDLILCTGDYVEHKWQQHHALPTLERFIAGLSAAGGVGNPG